MKTLKDYMDSTEIKLVHENKKIKWTVMDDGNYQFANRSPVKPICYLFSPNTKVRHIDFCTRIGDYVKVVSINGSPFTFKVQSK